MKPTQLKYAMARVSAIHSQKAREIIKRYEKFRKTLSDEKRLELLRSGRVKVKKEIRTLRDYDYVRNVFDFSEYEGLAADHEKALHFENETLNEKVHRIQDELALGDEARALELLRAFESDK